MTDIVERLRGRLAFPADEALLREAAHEIEQLRKHIEILAHAPHPADTLHLKFGRGVMPGAKE